MYAKIKKRVNELIRKYGSRDPFEIAECLGIELTIAPLGDIAGAYLYLKKRRVIFLNDSLDENERLVVMAHELGHAELHRKENCYFIKNKTLLLTSKLEIQANYFAAELLIDETKLDNQSKENMTISQIACYFGFPCQLVEYKFNK